MAITFLDRVKVNTSTTGTGSPIALGSAVSSFVTVAGAGGVDGQTHRYLIEDGTDWEISTGVTSSSGTSITRVFGKSSTGSALNLSGSATVAIIIAAADINVLGAVLVEEHTASSSATLNFTTAISSAYDEYLIKLVNVIPATNAVNLYMRMSTDGGSTYDSGTNYAWAAASLNRFSYGSAGADSGQTFIRINQSAIDNTSTKGVCGSISLFNPLSTSVHKNTDSKISIVTGGIVETDPGTGWYLSTTAVNAFQFLFSSGNISSGTIRVYGIVK